MYTYPTALRHYTTTLTSWWILAFYHSTDETQVQNQTLDMQIGIEAYLFAHNMNL
jgi:hypothetical protein